MQIRIATLTDVDDWAKLRAQLWPDSTVGEHRREVIGDLSSGGEGKIAILAVDDLGRITGFAEAALRHDYVNGCETSPVLFLEGVYISPEHQGAGLGRKLCAAVERWGRTLGCTEMASDALLENGEGHAFHRAIGFEETERVVYFRKAL